MNPLKQLPSASAAGNALTKLIEAWNNAKNVREQEITKRESIRAIRDINLAKLKNEQEIVKQYLTYIFEERKMVITDLFKRLDMGIASGNNELIGYAMQGIVATVQSSPLRGVCEIMRQIDDPDVKCIEI